jgi:hypothetical protein
MFGIRLARNRRDALNVSIGLGIQEDRVELQYRIDSLRKLVKEAEELVRVCSLQQVQAERHHVSAADRLAMVDQLLREAENEQSRIHSEQVDRMMNRQ